MKFDKRNIYSQIREIIERKEAELKLAVEEAESSRDSDTKSSAGDKHETARAMAQIEIEHLQVQLQRVIQSKGVLDRLNIEVRMSKGQLGAMIDTDTGYYFLSIGLGPLELAEGGRIYVVSPQSPIGQKLMGKSEGESISLNNRRIQIKGIN